MICPNCDSVMSESYDAKTGGNRSFFCGECGFTLNAFDAYASIEGYPADKDEFEDWMHERLLDIED